MVIALPDCARMRYRDSVSDFFVVCMYVLFEIMFMGKHYSVVYSIIHGWVLYLVDGWDSASPG